MGVDHLNAVFGKQLLDLEMLAQLVGGKGFGCVRSDSIALFH
jgi:hypothetical protein